MDVQIPVLLYDVMTTASAPRLVATFRHADPAQDIATRLNALRDASEVDDDPFVVLPRTATKAMTVVPGSSVSVMGYSVDVEALAVVLLEAEQTKGTAAPVDSDVVPAAGIRT